MDFTAKDITAKDIITISIFLASLALSAFAPLAGTAQSRPIADDTAHSGLS
jgi:hypothetical protein